MAAHAYQRGLFIEHGFTLWNNLWYSGHYSFVTYSVLYYPLAAVLGIRVLAVATVAVTALAFALVTWHEWGPTARWSSRNLAIVWAGIVLAGAYPFALGFALALFAVQALQKHAQWRFAVLVLLTLAASPLAFALLTLIAVGVALAKRVDARRHLVAAVALATTGAFEIVLWRIFPDDGRYPFSIADLAAVSAFSALGAALLWKVERARALAHDLRGLRIRVRRRISHSLCDGLEHHATPVRGYPDRGARRVASRLAAIAALPVDRRARGLLERETARQKRLPGARESRRGTGLLAAGDPIPAHAPDAVLPRRGGRHGRSLAGRVPPRRGDPARTRLVPAGRFPRERRPLRPADASAVRGVAPRARGALRTALPRKAGLQRPVARRRCSGVVDRVSAWCSGPGT